MPLALVRSQTAASAGPRSHAPTGRTSRATPASARAASVVTSKDIDTTHRSSSFTRISSSLLATHWYLLPRCLQPCSTLHPPVDPGAHRLAHSIALLAGALAPLQLPGLRLRRVWRDLRPLHRWQGKQGAQHNRMRREPLLPLPSVFHQPRHCREHRRPSTSC